MFFFSPNQIPFVLICAALKWSDLEECVRWMVPFAMSIREVGSSALRPFKGIPADDMHNIQTHAAYLDWMVRAFVVCAVFNHNVLYQCVALFLVCNCSLLRALLVSSLGDGMLLPTSGRRSQPEFTNTVRSAHSAPQQRETRGHSLLISIGLVWARAEEVQDGTKIL